MFGLKATRWFLSLVVVTAGIGFGMDVAWAQREKPQESPEQEEESSPQNQIVHHHHYYRAPVPGYTGRAPVPGYTGMPHTYPQIGGSGYGGGGYGGGGYGGGGYGGGGGMTPALGKGVGAGAAARGAGQYKLQSAEAGQIRAETINQAIENHNYAVQSYYANRDMHNQWVASNQNSGPSASQMQRIAQSLEPGRLSASQFDRDVKVIHWPPLLRDSAFSGSREKLDHLFHDRTAENSGVDSASYGEIQQAADQMHDTLVTMLRERHLAPPTYISASHFIRSLAYEARFPPGA